MPVIYSEYSLDFDGVDDVVSVGNVAELDFDNTDTFSISVWVKITGSTDGYVTGKLQGTSPNLIGYGIYINGGQIDFFLSNTNQARVQATTPLVEGLWQHIICTHSGSSTAAGLTIYVDGAAQPTSTVEDTLGSTTLNTGSFLIGAQDTSFFHGLIDDVAVYDVELSPAEVSTIYNLGLPNDLTLAGPTSALVGYWEMGDGDTFPTITDHSASGNDGTMTGMVVGDIVADAPYQAEDVVSWSTYLYVQTTTGEAQAVGTDFPSTGIQDPPTYKMRALADPGPGYVTWVVEATPDFSGNAAPTAIQAGSAVITTSWDVVAVQFVQVPTIDILQNVADSTTATDPGRGLTLVLVDTADASWDHLDTITLPAGPQVGAEVIVKDDGGQAGAENIVVSGNGNDIDGQTTQTLTVAREAIHLLFDGTEWRIL